MFIGWPISTAFFSAAAMILRANSRFTSGIKILRERSHHTGNDMVNRKIAAPDSSNRPWARSGEHEEGRGGCSPYCVGQYVAQTPGVASSNRFLSGSRK